MKDKINIAELLKDCPEGMELDCILFENPVIYDGCHNGDNYPIKILTEEGEPFYLTNEGYISDSLNSKCVIFPKGKTTWKGFHSPFKDGDIVAIDSGGGSQVFIFKEYVNNEMNYAHCYMILDDNGSIYFADNNYYVGRLATEEEKQKLFDAIKANGYKWNAETKTLEKLIEPKFKVGDIVKSKNCPETDGFVIIDLKEDGYSINIKNYYIKFKDQDNYELVSNKFDINTLVPFESRVLVRDCIDEKWCPGIWGFYNKNSENYPYVSIGERSRYCIPYKGNEYLLGTTNDCDDYYKTWGTL